VTPPLVAPDALVRWGIAGTGGIARGFAQALARVSDARVAAVASRAVESAERFGDAHGAERRYGSYDAMAEDPCVDVVYVATPHARHCADTVMYLEAGKHVLCEKPFALNAAEAQRMVDAAAGHGRFLMEAIWSRFLPSYVELRALVSAGVIGAVEFVEASFGFRMPVDASHRLFAPELGGGALLDLGVYPVQLAEMLLGEPDRVEAVAHIGSTQVDERIAVTMGFRRGAVAVAEAAIRTGLACTARIGGTEGAVELPAFMHCPQHLEVRTAGEGRQIECPMEGNGLHYQAEEVHRCLRAGKCESAVMPLAGTLAIARTLDRARERVGLRYPGE
jgi:predicted dehydrogenase